MSKYSHSFPDEFDPLTEEEADALASVLADALTHDKLFDMLVDRGREESMKALDDEHRFCQVTHTGCSLDKRTPF